MTKSFVFECISCGDELELEVKNSEIKKPEISWKEAVKILKRNNWLVEGDGFEDHQVMCDGCNILEAK